MPSIYIFPRHANYQIENNISIHHYNYQLDNSILMSLLDRCLNDFLWSSDSIAEDTLR